MPNITNKEYETRTYNIKNVELIKESTSAKYTVSYEKSKVVEAEMKSSLSFSSSMPVDFYEFVKNEYGVNKKRIINSIPVRIAVENE